MTDVFAEPRVGGEYRLLRTIRRGPWMTYLADDDGGQQIRMTCIAGSAALHDELLQDVRRFQECSGARLVKPLEAVERQDMLVVIHPEPDAGDLAAFCAERTPKVGEALAIVAQIAEAVQSLHSGDLLHGWLDPQNILVASGSQVLVQGGGLHAAVKHYLTTRQALFHGSSMSENPFWAPELGIADTVQSDLYSLGRLLLFLLTGDITAAVQWSPAKQCWEVLNDDGDLTAQIAALPAAVIEILRRTLAVNVDDRFRDCGELLEALREADRMETATVASRVTGQQDLPPNRAACDLAFEVRTVGGRVLAALLLPALALVVAWLVGIRQTPVLESRQMAYQARVAAHPGHDALWWLDDQETYFLLPPIRRQIVRDRLLGDLPVPGVEGDAGSGPLRQKLKEVVFGDAANPKSKPLQIALTPPLQSALEGLVPGNKAHPNSQQRLRAALATVPAGPDAAEMHLRALLMHKLAESGAQPPGSPAGGNSGSSYAELAGEAYQAALPLYAWYEPGMAALCRADYARLLVRQGKHDEAERQLQLAESLARSMESEAWWLPFLLSVHEQLAAIHRKEGSWAKAEATLERAAALTGLDGDSPLVPKDEFQAFILERRGWYLMDRWRVEEAAACFSAAYRFRQCESLRLGPRGARSLELALHNRHGEAMALRYMGNCDQACQQYVAIISDLEKELKRHGPWSSAARTMLRDRLLNTLERLADCYLYSSNDYAETQAWLEVALDEAEQRVQLSEPADELVARLYFKKALAAAISGDLEASQMAFQRGQQLSVKAADAQGEDSLAPLKSAVLQYTRNLVRAYSEYRRGTSTVDDTYAALRREFIVLDRQSRISRDELDLIMLIARNLPAAPDMAESSGKDQAGGTQRLTPGTLRQIAQFNVALARLPQLGERNRSILNYVSGSYRHAIHLYDEAGRSSRSRELEEESELGYVTGQPDDVFSNSTRERTR